jgi:hypothetical protein
MQVAKFYKKKGRLQTGMLLLGLAFLLFPIFGLLSLLITPLFVVLFYLMVSVGFLKLYRNRAYLGKENSKFAIGALILFVLSWMQLLFLIGDIVMNQFILGFFFLFQSLAFFMILFIPVKNKVSLNLSALFLILGSVFVFLHIVCMAFSLIFFFPVGYLLMGIVSLISYNRIRKGEFDPVMLVEPEEGDLSKSVEKKKVSQSFFMHDGTTKTVKHNYRVRRNLGRTVTVAFAIIAVVLLISGIYCTNSGKQMLIDYVLDEMDEGGQETREDPEPKPEEERQKQGKPMLVGTVGILRFFEEFLYRDTPQENEVVEEGDDFDFLSITEEMFELSYHDMKLYDNGTVYDYSSNSYISFENEEEVQEEEKPPEPQPDEGQEDNNGFSETLKEKWFPIGDLEKKSYFIWDPLAPETVEARYMKEEEVKGQRCFVYNVKLENQTLIEIDDWDGNPFRVWADEDTDYYLDSKTTIPVNLHIKLNLGVDFPDLTRLQPDIENRVENRTVTVLIKDPDSMTGWKMEEVREEHHRTTYLDSEDTNILWFEGWVERYDNSTGEPLEPEQQEHAVIKFAVDRTTYQYVPGLGNAQRRGYYAFPIGKIRPIDYDMWDEGSNQQVKARFIKETAGPLGRPVYLFEMKAENFTFDETDLLFPIDNPGALELVGDTTTRFWLDKETGFPLDLSQELVVSIRSGGPMHGVKEPVYYAYYELPEEAKNNLSKFVNLIAIILKCISSKSLMVFSIDIQFASDLQNQLADVARLIGYVFDSLDYWIPVVTIGLGSLIMLIILLKLYFNYKHRKKKRQKLEANLKRIEKD